MSIDQVLTMEQFREEIHKPSLHESMDLSAREDSGGFSNTKTYSEAIHLLENGWPEGLKQVDFLSSRARDAQPQSSFDFSPYHDVHGSTVDMGRYLSGDPECMIDYRIEKQAKCGRVVRVVVNAACSASMSSIDYYRRGVAALKIIDAFETAGYRCEVVAGTVSKCPQHWFSAQVTVKDPDQPLDMDRLAFFLAHPAMERRLFFRLHERLPFVLPAYGQPAPFPRKPGEIHINEMHSDQLKTPEAITRFVETTLAEYLEPAPQHN